MIDARQARRHPAPTWAQASTSTSAPIGSSATPTAERAGRWSPKQLDVHLVHAGVVGAQVLQEHGGLGDVGEGRALGRQQALEVGDRLAELAVEPARHQLAVGDADLAGHDQPLTGSHDRCVGTDRLGHGLQSVSASDGRSASRSGSRGGSQAAAATAANTASPPRTGAAPLGVISTSIGGVSTARRTPKDRMVRSWTVPPASTAMPSLLTHASAMWAAPDAVRAQHDLVDGLAGVDPHADGAAVRPRLRRRRR